MPDQKVTAITVTSRITADTVEAARRKFRARWPGYRVSKVKASKQERRRTLWIVSGTPNIKDRAFDLLP